MRKHLCKVLAVLFAVASVTSGCDSRKTTESLNNKNDSLKFARSVMKAYGTESVLAEQEQEPPQKAGMMAGDSMRPISWETYVQYRDYYDKNPVLMNPDSKPYKGYTIDASGYNKLLNNPAIKGLYLRLGRKEDGSYTIMILGTDAGGQVLTTSDTLVTGSGNGDSNFDNLNPCPLNCPKIED